MQRGNIDEIKESILNLISEGETVKAIEKLKESKELFPKIGKYLPLLSSRYHSLLEKRNLQVISYDTHQLEINKINLAIIQFLENENMVGFKTIENEDNGDHNKDNNVIRNRIFLFIGMAIVVLLSWLLLNQYNKKEELPEISIEPMSISITTEIDYENDSFDAYKNYLNNTLNIANATIRSHRDSLSYLQDSLGVLANVIESESKEIKGISFYDNSPIHPNIFCDPVVNFAMKYNDVSFSFYRNPVPIDSFVTLQSTFNEISNRSVRPDSTTLVIAEEIYDRIKSDLSFSFTTGLDDRGLAAKHEIEYTMERNTFYLDAFNVAIDPKYHYVNTGYLNSIDDLLGAQIIVSFPTTTVSDLSQTNTIDALLPTYNSRNKVRILFLKFSNGQEFIIRGEKMKRIILDNVPYFFYTFPERYEEFIKVK